MPKPAIKLASQPRPEPTVKLMTNLNTLIQTYLDNKAVLARLLAEDKELQAQLKVHAFRGFKKNGIGAETETHEVRYMQGKNVYIRADDLLKLGISPVVIEKVKKLGTSEYTYPMVLEKKAARIDREAEAVQTRRKKAR